MVKQLPQTLQRVLYIPHDEVPGVDLPGLFWNPQTGAFEFGSMRTPVDVTFYGNVNFAGAMSRSRAQMNNCGKQNLRGVVEGDPLMLPFGAGSADPPIFTMANSVIQVQLEGLYLLSYCLPFTSNTGLVLQGTSVGACWQTSMDGQDPWTDQLLTKTYDTVHGVTDDDGSLALPPVELHLQAGTYLRVVGFQTGTNLVDVFINGMDGFRVMTAPPPPPPNV